jgi:hypothetical protein
MDKNWQMKATYVEVPGPGIPFKPAERLTSTDLQRAIERFAPP